MNEWMNEWEKITIQDLLKQELYDKIGNKSHEEQLTWYTENKKDLQSFTDPEIQLIIETFEKIIELQNQLKAMDQQVPTQGQENEDTKKAQTIEEQIKEAKEKIETLTQEVAEKKCKLESMNNELQALQKEKQELEDQKTEKEKIKEFRIKYKESNDLRSKRIRSIDTLIKNPYIDKNTKEHAKELKKIREKRTYQDYIRRIEWVFDESKKDTNITTITKKDITTIIEKILIHNQPDVKKWWERLNSTEEGEIIRLTDPNGKDVKINQKRLKNIKDTDYKINGLTYNDFLTLRPKLEHIEGDVIQSIKYIKEEIQTINDQIKEKQEKIKQREKERKDLTESTWETESNPKKDLEVAQNRLNLLQLKQEREKVQEQFKQDQKRKQIEEDIAAQRTKIETEDITLQLFDLNKIQTAYQKKVLEVIKSNPNITKEEFHNQTKNTITNSYTRKEIYKQIEDRRTLVQNLIATKQKELIDTLNNSWK